VFLRKYGICLQDCTVSEPRGPPYVTIFLIHLISSLFRIVTYAITPFHQLQYSRCADRNFSTSLPVTVIVRVRIFRPPASERRLSTNLMRDASPREQWSDCTVRRVEVIGREMQHTTRQRYTALCSVMKLGYLCAGANCKVEPFDVLAYNRTFYKANKSSSSVASPSKY
jgi:hypothetical protein